MGYAQSKLVSERLCSLASKSHHLPTTIARVGQISGDTHNGQWNTSDAISMLIQSSQTLHCLPSRYMDVDYLPVDIVSRTIVQLLLSSARSSITNAASYVDHVVNPRSMSWIKLMRLLQKIGLSFDVVDPLVWLDALTNTTASIQQVPALKLLNYFTALYMRKDEQPQPSITFDTSDTTSIVPDMEYDLNQQYWSKVIKYWCSQGFLQCSSGTKF